MACQPGHANADEHRRPSADRKHHEVVHRYGRPRTSGNSSAPHLHFQVVDSPPPRDTSGLPYRFSRFAVDGWVTNFGAFGGGTRARIAPKLRWIHRGELPLNDQVLDFVDAGW